MRVVELNSPEARKHATTLTGDVPSSSLQRKHDAQAGGSTMLPGVGKEIV